ncbi:MAG: response regulator transcription factor [Saprospiraceae bacterium]|nr:response regulator transcription factor [Saprospiraceae bacterium]
MIRVSIIENDKFLCETLRVVLNAKNVIEVVSIYLNGEDALKELPKLKPDIVLVDIDLGLKKMNGIECITRLKPELPDTQFLILTIFDEHQKVFDALSAGALGYVLKSDKPEKIINAIQDLHEGGAPMSPSIARKIALTFSHENHINPLNASLLTSREKEVIELISKGKLEKEVANELFISYKTVKTHITNIYTKLQVNTRVEALNKYFGR